MIFLLTALQESSTCVSNVPSRMDEEEVQDMIDGAIRRHNRNASIISIIIGWVMLAAFMDGLLRLLGLIPPFMGLDINLLPRIADLI